MRAETPIGRLRDLALAAGADELAEEAAALEGRIREQRFHVACVGQFKRGKSTLLNALIGRPLLPTGVVPVTSVPTVLRYGPVGVRVRTAAGWAVVAPETLEDYVTEQHNPENIRGVLVVEVSVPAAILEGGLCLVDTPGIGSVIETGAEATRAFVPHIDAALVVLGTDPPISGEELGLVGMIARQADTLVFVLNKIDRVTAQERAEAHDFLVTVLRDRLGVDAGRVYHVAAAAEGGGPDWDALKARLRGLAGSRREALVQGALRRGATRIGGALSARLHERRMALTRPLEEYRERAAQLSRLGRSSERAILELAPLFGAEEQRLERAFRARADEFLAEARPAGLARLEASMSEGRLAHMSHEEALEESNGIARALAYPWLRGVEKEAEADYGRVVRRFRRMTDEHLRRLVEATGVAADAMSVSDGPEGFRVRSHFAFSDRVNYHYPRSPLPWLVVRLLPVRLRQRWLQHATEQYLLDLLTVNASRVVGDLAERVRESRREVEAEIRHRLRQVGDRAAGALQWAQAVRARGAEEVTREVTRLEALLAEVERVLEPMRGRAA